MRLPVPAIKDQWIGYSLRGNLAFRQTLPDRYEIALCVETVASYNFKIVKGHIVKVINTLRDACGDKRLFAGRFDQLKNSGLLSGAGGGVVLVIDCSLSI